MRILTSTARDQVGAPAEPGAIGNVVTLRSRAPFATRFNVWTRSRARAALLLLAAVLAGGCGGDEQPSAERPAPRGLTEQSGQERESQPYVEMTLRRPPRRISGDAVLVSGTVAPSDATVTIRGEPAVVKDGEYRLRLKMRVGTNRFTVVARHPDHQTNTRRVRVDRRPPPLVVPPPAVADPPSVDPPPAESAPSGLVPCIYGERVLCTPEENQAESETEARCGPLDPSRIQPDGSYLPKPGC